MWVSRRLSFYFLPDDFRYTSSIESFILFVYSPRTVVIYLLSISISSHLCSTVCGVYLCVCVDDSVLETTVHTRVCINVSFLSLTKSTPIRLLHSVMGAQRGLRSAPWSVLICLAFCYRPDTLPVTWKETQTTSLHLQPSPLLHFFFSFLLGALSPSAWHKQTHAEIHTSSFHVCISAFTPLPQDEAKWGQIDMNPKETSQGVRKKIERKKVVVLCLRGNCKHKSTDILLCYSLCKCIHSSPWRP